MGGIKAKNIPGTSGTCVDMLPTQCRKPSTFTPKTMTTLDARKSIDDGSCIPMAGTHCRCTDGTAILGARTVGLATCASMSNCIAPKCNDTVSGGTGGLIPMGPNKAWTSADNNTCISMKISECRNTNSPYIAISMSGKNKSRLSPDDGSCKDMENSYCRCTNSGLSKVGNKKGPHGYMMCKDGCPSGDLSQSPICKSSESAISMDATKAWKSATDNSCVQMTLDQCREPSDAFCSNCTSTCPDNHYIEYPCDISHNLVCKPCTVCGTGQYTLTACDVTGKEESYNRYDGRGSDGKDNMVRVDKLTIGSDTVCKTCGINIQG